MKTIEATGRASVRAGICALALGGVAAAVGCGDDTTGTGGAGGEGTTSTSSASPTSSSSVGNTSTSTNVGPGGGGEGGIGEGGTGGEGGFGGSGSGGDGGAGGASSACLDADAFSDLFTLGTDKLCVVALYDAPDLATTSYGNQPTWGRHGGLLTGSFIQAVEAPISGVELVRWTAPDGTGGELTTSDEGTDLDLGADADFGGSQIVDIDAEYTAFTYTGADFTNEGGVVFFGDDDGEVDVLIGGFGIGMAVSGDVLLHTSLTVLGGSDSQDAGLYGAVSCAPEALFCDGYPISLWGNGTGPLAVDGDGNTFAVMVDFVEGTQTARGFSADEIASGDETDGVDLFTIDGFGTPLAALAPVGAEPGLLAFQASNAETFLQEPPILVGYRADDDGLVAEGAPESLLTLTADGTPVSLVSDDGGRIWVGVTTETGTRFAVLARP